MVLTKFPKLFKHFNKVALKHLKMFFKWQKRVNYLQLWWSPFLQSYSSHFPKNILHYKSITWNLLKLETGNF